MVTITQRRTLARPLLLLLATVFAAACGGSNTPNAPNAPTGGVSVAVAPISLSVTAGGTGTVSATVSRRGAFTGAVALSVGGVPPGLTVTPAPTSLPGGATTASISVSVGPSVAAGNYPVQVLASGGSGITPDSAQFVVRVVAAGSGGVSITPAPAALTVVAGGGAVTSALTLTRTTPFTGAVDLSVTGAPANVTATLAPTSATSNSATLTVTAAATAVNGIYPLVVRGAAAGISDALATVQLTVSGGAVAGVTLVPSPSALNVVAGGTAGTATVTINRTGGFAGPVNLTAAPAAGTPSGLTANITPNANVSGGSATLTVGVAAGTSAGNYSITVTASGSGIPTATVSVPVNVTASGSTGGTSFAFCAVDAPIWVAVQDGPGNWQRVAPTSGSTYAIAFPSGRGGVASVDTTGGTFSVQVTYLAARELAAYARSLNFNRCSARTLNGSVAGVSDTQEASVALGFTPADFQSPSTYTLTGVASGPQDLVAARFVVDQFGPAVRADRVVIRRGVNLPNGATIPVIDFNSSEAFAPVTFNATITGTRENVFFATLFLGQSGSAGGTFAALASPTGRVMASAIPLSRLQPDEFQAIQLIEVDQTFASFPRRLALVAFRAPVDRSIALGPLLNAPTFSDFAAVPVVRPRMRLVSQTDYNRFVSVSFSQFGGSSVTVSASADYFNGTPGTWELTVPDFSGVAGWLNAWGLRPSVPYQWTVSASGGALAELDQTFTEGATTITASRSSGFLPP